MTFNYSAICSRLTEKLPPKQKEVILRRFGLTKFGQKETLESIGKDFGITRERVRQIEEQGIARLKPHLKECQKIFQHFTDQLKETGNLRKEDAFLELLANKKFQKDIRARLSGSRSLSISEFQCRNNQIFFLLTLNDFFTRFPETKDYYSLWTVSPQSVSFTQEVIGSFYAKLLQTKKPISLKDCKLPVPKLNSKNLIYCLEISKQIQQNPEGLYGLKDWPEINPRGVKDKAYLVFKKEARPLHFTEVARFIAEQNIGEKKVCPNPQSVHNELIRDPRFVLVGRGLYSLEEWGYTPGVVKDVILKVLREAKEPLATQDIVSAVLKQRFVKENTILLNLSNKKYFTRTPEGKYIVKEI